MSSNLPSRWWLYGLLAGLLINVCDVTITILFAADPWTAVLSGQGIAFNPLTPPFYISVSFLGGVIAVWLYLKLKQPNQTRQQGVLVAALLVWGISRMYGLGHVVMGQMPLWIFATMSGGLLLGYLVGLSVATALMERRQLQN